MPDRVNAPAMLLVCLSFFVVTIYACVNILCESYGIFIAEIGVNEISNA